MTDQTPITRGDLRSLFLRLQAPGNESLVEKFDAWCAAETSASPPRVPEASAHPVREGVESGPGQPITEPRPPYCADIVPELIGWAALYDDPEDTRARTLREAAAEIRRQREQITALKFSLDLARDCDKEAAQLIAEGRRDGIEEAAQWHEQRAYEFSCDDDQRAQTIAACHRSDAAAIRALADKSAFDPLLAGLEYVRREWFKIRTTGATLAEWLDAQIAARTAQKGGDNG